MKLLAVLFALLTINAYSQELPGDTIYVVMEKRWNVKGIQKRIDRNLVQISKDSLFLGAKRLSITDSTRLQNSKIPIGHYIYKYYIFTTKDGERVLKSLYGFESFNGPYKEYYSNGNIKAQGVLDYGKKIGVWKYYSKQGKLEKEITY